VKTEMGGACSTYRKYAYSVLVWRPECKDNLQELRIVSNMKMGWGHGLD